MKKLLFIFISVILVSSLVACNNQHPETEQTIRVGDTIPGAHGETFEIYVWDENSRLLTDDKAKVTVNVVLEKENDINKKADYDGERFYKYSYSVSISGNVDPKYVGKTIYLYLNWIPEYHVSRSTNYGEKGMVSEDGTFNYSYTFRSNAVLTEWVPNRVIVK